MLSSANDSSFYDQTEETLSEAQKGKFKQPNFLNRSLLKTSLLNNSALPQAILTSADITMMVTDQDGIIQLFNMGAERMLGYQAHEVLNKVTPIHFCDLQTLMLMAETLSVALGIPISSPLEALVCKARHGIEGSDELIYIHKDGTRLPTMVSVSALRDRQNAIIGYLLIGPSNIACKKTIEQSSQFFALSQEILAVIGFDGYFKHLNMAWERALGYEIADILGKPFIEFVLPEDRFTTLAEVEKLKLGGSMFAFENRYVCKDGSFRWLLWSVTTSIADQLFYCSARDITERKQAEQALEESEAFNLAILNSLGAEIAVLDSDGVIRAVNEPWRRFATENSIEPNIPAPMTGVGSNYLTACTSDNGKVLPDVLDIYEGIQGVLAGTLSSFNMEYPCHSPNQQRWFTMNVLPLGQVAKGGAVIAHTEITVYKRLDQVLQANNIELESAKLLAEKANLAKSDFLSNMSHELRTPLNAILGFAQLVEAGSPVLTYSQKRSVEQIIKAGWYLLDLINEILDLALIESGKLSLSVEYFSLMEVVRECEEMMAPLAKKYRIQMSFPQSGTPLFLNADRTRIKQVLINLLSNAIKYNRQDGKVRLKYSATGNGRIRISVEDSGEGLAQNMLGQLFQPFNRLGQESNAEEGTGIGLVVSKRLVETMGGSIGVESTVGQGSTFWFEMNLAPKPEKLMDHGKITSVTNHTSPIGNAALSTMLYVEDNPANQLLVENIMLQRPDIRLLSATSAEQGIALAQKYLPDIILMDINLPGMNGDEAFKRLAEKPATACIPIIALSANAVMRDIETCLKLGFFCYLTKPIKLNPFMNTLDAAMALAKKTQSEKQACEDKINTND